jgi:hypothetical protein
MGYMGGCGDLVVGIHYTWVDFIHPLLLEMLRSLVTLKL